MGWPTTNEPKTEFVTLRFTVREMADVDAAASTAGMTRSAYLRDCVTRVQRAREKQAERLRTGAVGDG